jgi:hypothetical protein
MSCDAKQFPDSYPCKECGEYEREANWSKGTLIEGHCFNCSFFLRLCNITQITDSIRIDHNHYSISPENEPGIMRGYGGRHFRIRLSTGLELETTNLWHQGSIPERFWDRLYDNADFVSGEDCQ